MVHFPQSDKALGTTGAGKGKSGIMNIKAMVLIVLTAVYLYEMALNLIRMRSAGNPVPENVADVYDPETYGKWRRYHGEKSRLALVTSTVSWIISMLLMSLNVYAAFANLFPKDNPYTQMIAVMLLSALAELPLLPFSWYDTMRIEEKYGFNRSSKKTFWADQVKAFLISLGLMIGIGCILIAVHQALGDWLIVVFAGAMMLLVLLFVFLYPVFSKIFNKFTPLEDGELKERLTALLEKHGYHVRGIQVMDASRRTTKSNAYFTGFGKMKTIVLYDTLVSQMTPDEICAVFAHELGHGLHHDTLRNQILTSVQMLVIAALAWLTLRSAGIYPPFGFEGVNYGFAIILIMSVEFALFAPLFGLLVNWFSRRAEYRADAQAVKEGYGVALITGLKKLARENFSELAPSPLLVKLTYSHPPLSERITAIEKLQQKR